MELTQEQFDKTIQEIKREINKPTSGNCRVGYALKISAGQQFEKSRHNIEKIANSIILERAYIRQPSLQVIGDVNILRNPEYKKQQLEIDLVKSNIEANKLNKENSGRNFWFSIINIILGVLNLLLLAYQAYKIAGP